MAESLSMDQAFIKKLTDIVIANLTNENFGAEELAKEAGMSRANLYRKLKSFKHKDLSQFIREIRLKRAMEMLQENEGTASEIAFRVGFGSPIYFNKCFHDYYGYPPGEARKRTSAGQEQNYPDELMISKGTGDESGQKKKAISFIKTLYFKNVLITISGILTGLLIIYFIYKQFLPNPEKSIAVLPFKNNSPSDSNTYFINGLMDKVLNNLQVVKELRVISRTSVEQYRNTTKSVSEIARELGVNYIVEGSGQKYGNSFSVSVQLIKARKEDHLWGQTFEQQITGVQDIYDIQNQIATTIAEKLKATITPKEKLLMEKLQTTSLKALYFYQKGKAELSKLTSERTNRLTLQAQMNNKQEIAKAKELFIQALKYDSTYANAYIGLAYTTDKVDSMNILADKALSYDNQSADAYLLKGDYYSSIHNATKAFEEYDKAIKINPNFWEAYYHKGIISGGEIRDLIVLFDNLHKAASLNRGSEYADILYELARLYRNAGFYEKSNEIALEVLNLNGDSVRYLSHLGAAEISIGNYEKALELVKKAYAIDSTNTRIWGNLGEAYNGTGDWKEMLKYYKKYSASIQLNEMELAKLGFAYSKNGYNQEAECIFDSLLELVKNWGDQNPIAGRDRAYVYAFRGEKEKVFEDLKIYSQVSEQATLKDFIMEDLRINHLFDSIRDEPEFKKIYMEFEAKFQAQQERTRKWLEQHNML